MGLVSSGFKSQNFESEEHYKDLKVDRDKLLQAEPSQRAAHVLRETSSKYPELDQQAKVEQYQKEVQNQRVSEEIKPIQIKSRRTNMGAEKKEGQDRTTKPYQPIDI